MKRVLQIRTLLRNHGKDEKCQQIIKFLCGCRLVDFLESLKFHHDEDQSIITWDCSLVEVSELSTLEFNSNIGLGESLIRNGSAPDFSTLFDNLSMFSIHSSG